MDCDKGENGRADERMDVAKGDGGRADEKMNVDKGDGGHADEKMNVDKGECGRADEKMNGDREERGRADVKMNGDKGDRGCVDEKPMSQSKTGADDKFLDNNLGGDCFADTKNTMSESEAMKKCLEENKGDYSKCKSKVQALQSSPSSSLRKPLSPMKLKRGSLVDA